MNRKRELRQRIKALKGRFSQQELREMSACIIGQLLEHPRVQHAETLLMYHSLPDEVFTHDAVDALVAQGKEVLLPKVVSDTEMTIHQYRSQADLAVGSYGILEPSGVEFLDYADIDVCIVPGVAFTKDGKRLGRGRGYYDRFLKKMAEAHASASKPDSYKIGICFPFQIVDDIPMDETDVIMDEIVEN